MFAGRRYKILRRSIIERCSETVMTLIIATPQFETKPFSICRGLPSNPIPKAKLPSEESYSVTIFSYLPMEVSIPLMISCPL